MEDGTHQMPVVKTRRSACSHCSSMLFRYLLEKSVEHIMKIIFFHFLSFSRCLSITREQCRRVWRNFPSVQYTRIQKGEEKEQIDVHWTDDAFSFSLLFLLLLRLPFRSLTAKIVSKRSLIFIGGLREAKISARWRILMYLYRLRSHSSYLSVESDGDYSLVGLVFTNRTRLWPRRLSDFGWWMIGDGDEWSDSARNRAGGIGEGVTVDEAMLVNIWYMANCMFITNW